MQIVKIINILMIFQGCSYSSILISHIDLEYLIY